MTSQTAPMSANPRPAASRPLRPEPPPSSDHPPVDPELSDQWNDTGGNWWHGSRAPSFRIDPRESAGRRRAPGRASA